MGNRLNNWELPPDPEEEEPCIICAGTKKVSFCCSGGTINEQGLCSICFEHPFIEPCDHCRGTGIEPESEPDTDEKYEFKHDK